METVLGGCKRRKSWRKDREAKVVGGEKKVMTGEDKGMQEKVIKAK